jgi:N-acetylglucosaminyl-diphospho-decaprenol L-rhamnosyltransferase
MARVDVVVVSYNSRNQLRDCVEPLVGMEDVNVIVVDNASTDGSLAVIEDLPVEKVQLERNGGFAFGCNAGWRRGRAEYVLLLNPDARIDFESLGALAKELDADPTLALVAPRIVHADGSLDFSQRRFPRLRSTYAQALFLHRLFPRADWTDEVIREEAAYASPGSPDWVSGAAMLLRRSVLEELGGLDEGFFLYCEDIDLCCRIRRAGYGIAYVPSATVVHEGGASAPRPGLYPVLAASRIRYAKKNESVTVALVERVGIGLGALTHVVVSGGGAAARRGHLAALRRVTSRATTID